VQQVQEESIRAGGNTLFDESIHAGGNTLFDDNPYMELNGITKISVQSIFLTNPEYDWSI